jgi:hypothetical protein
VGNEQDQDRQADDGSGEAEHEDVIETVRYRSQHGERDKRPGQRTGRVQSSMNPKRSTQRARIGTRRDQRVAWRGTNALPGPVHGDH